MKKVLSILTVCILVLSLAACGNRSDIAEPKDESSRTETQQEQNSASEETKKVASDGAQMQTDDPSMPTRVLEEETRINMHFGDTVIPGILNNSTTAQAFIEKLPLTVHESRYSHFITEKLAKKEQIERFLAELERQDGVATEFDEEQWYSLVDFVTVFNKEDIRFTFKDGTEIKVQKPCGHRNAAGFFIGFSNLNPPPTRQNQKVWQNQNV